MAAPFVLNGSVPAPYPTTYREHVTTVLPPRLVVAGTASGVGKTTVATGLLAALRRRGVTAAPAKVGPDYIDPGYHGLAAGRPGRNLDAWICGPDIVAPLAGRAGAGAEVLVVEGVMGLFDGSASPREAGGAVDSDLASTAEVARLLDAPIVLVVDAAATSRSAAALVHGFATFDPSIRVAGVVLNRVGSDSHEAALRDALAPVSVPVLGALRRDDALTWRDRHLGLVPVVEHPELVRTSLDRLATAIERAVDVDAVLALARTAPQVAVPPPPLPRRVGTARVAVAGGPAFSFAYPDNLEALQAAGAEVVPFDPLVDRALPAAVDALVAGGGFPEVYAAQLADNRPLLDDVAARVRAGLVTWAECGGLLWLARSLDGTDLAGVVATDATMTGRLTLGYRRATVATTSPLGPAGSTLWGHEFHYSTTEPAGDGLALEGRTGATRAGWVTPTLFASYLHLHLGGAPQVAEAFVAAAAGIRSA
jgi:cobyrinic acid a,c-diamide synthase